MLLQAIKHYPNVLLLRIRAPISADLDQNNLLTKLFMYKRILNIEAVSINDSTNDINLSNFKCHFSPALCFTIFYLALSFFPTIRRLVSTIL